MTVVKPQLDQPSTSARESGRSDIGFTRRLLSGNFVALMVNTGAQAVLGFAFFVVAARRFDEATIGPSLATIALVRGLGPLSQLGLNEIVLRRLPIVARPHALLLRTMLAVLGVATALGAVFLVAGNDRLHALDAGYPSWLPYAVVAAIALFGITALQDAALITIGRSLILPIESVVFGVLGIALLAVTSKSQPYDLFLAWAAPAVIATGIGSITLANGLARRRRPAASSVSVAAEAKTWFSDFAGLALISVERAVLPTLVLRELGSSSAASFAIAFAIAIALHEGLSGSVTSFVADAANHPEHRYDATLASMRRVVFVGLPITVVAFVGAHPLLSIFGSSYAAEGTQTLRLMVAAAPGMAIAQLAIAQCRLDRKPALPILLFLAHTTFILGGAALLVADHGVVSIGVLYLIAELGVGLVGLVVINRRLELLRARQFTTAPAVKAPESRPAPVRRVFAPRPPPRRPGLEVLVLLPVGLAAAAAAYGDWHNSVLAVVQFAALLVWPGYAVVQQFRSLSVTARAALTAAVSLAVWLLASQVMLAVRAWHPVGAYLAILGASMLYIAEMVWRNGAALTWPRTTGRGTESPVDGRGWLAPAFSVMLGAAAIAAFVFTVGHFDRNDATQIGLASALPWPYWVGLVLIGLLLINAILRSTVSTIAGTASIGLLILFYHGLMPLETRLPRFFWTTKHIGVIEFISANHGVNRNVDVYHNWPSFFGASSLYSSVSRADPLYYARWSHLVMSILFAVAVFAIFELLTDNRRVHFLATFLFIAAQWTGQEYFSPQAVAFFLYLAFLIVVLAYMSDFEDFGLAGALRRRLLEPIARSTTIRPDWIMNRRIELRQHQGREGVALGVLLFTALAWVHQLTPFAAALVLTALVIMRRVYPAWTPLFAFAMLAVVVGFAYRFLHQAGIDLFKFDLGAGNKRRTGVAYFTNTDTGGGRLISLLTAVLMAILIIGAVFGLIRRLRNGFSELEAAIIAACPAVLVLAQGYDGEGIYRAFLYALPGLAYLTASFVMPRYNAWTLANTRRVAVVLACGLALLWPLVAFGREKTAAMFDDEVTAERLIEAAAPQGSAITTFTGGFPTRLTADYPRLNGPGLPPLLALADVRKAATGHDAGVQLVVEVNALAGRAPGNVFVVFSRTDRNYIEQNNLIAPERLSEILDVIRTSPSLEAIYTAPDAEVYRVRET